MCVHIHLKISLSNYSLLVYRKIKHLGHLSGIIQIQKFIFLAYQLSEGFFLICKQLMDFSDACSILVRDNMDFPLLVVSI